MMIARREMKAFGRVAASGVGLRSRMRLVMAVCFLCGALLLGGGFVHFVFSIPRRALQVSPADGVVALTGGADRIADAADLLAAGQARRLLISGVNQSTSKSEIARLTPNLGDLLACCVDLDHAALNTAGNAVETARWARTHGLRSVIVVTSDYHMPRALVEMRRMLPEADLKPHAVPTARLKSTSVFVDPEMMRMVAWEYLKYVRAVARSVLTPAPAVASRFASKG